MKRHLKTGMLAFLLSLVFFHPHKTSAQYFGRNKVLYQNFDFRVLQSPHFEIYTYLQDKEKRNRFTERTEQWYRIHQVLLQTLDFVR